MSLAISASALAVSNQAPSKASTVITGGESFTPNAFVKDSLRFAPGTITIRSGGTLTVVNKASSGEPHTLSLVKRSDLPRNVKQVDNCGMAAPGTICNTLIRAHGVDPNGPPPSGPPPKTRVDVGSPGFDQPGDSAFIPPKGSGPPVSLKVTAKPGTTLYFMCIIHPWMQGRILVK